MRTMRGGLEPDRVRALLAALLRSELLGTTAGSQVGASLAMGAIFQAAVGLGVGSLLYLGLPARELAIAGMALVAVLSALLLGPDAGQIAAASDDERLKALPASAASLRAARLLHAAAYVVLGTSGAAIPMAVFVAFAAESFVAAPLFVLAASAQTLVFALSIGSLDSLLQRTRAGALLRPLVSIGAGAFLVFVLLLGIRPLPDLLRWMSENAGTISALPFTWFASIALLTAHATDTIKMAAAWGALAMVASGALALLAAKLARRSSGQQLHRASPARGVLRRLATEAERATFDFTLVLVSREQDRALRAGPIFAFPLALLLLGAAMEDPRERRLFLHIALFVSNAYLPAACQLLARSKDANARWIFDTAPTHALNHGRDGIFKASIFFLLMPFVGSMLAAIAWANGAEHALLHALPLASVALWVLDRGVQALPDPFPGGQEAGRLGTSAGEGILGLAFLLTGVGFVEARVVTHPIHAIAWAAAVCMALVFVRRRRGAAAL